MTRITSPRRGTAQLAMSFLASPGLISPIKRKAGLKNITQAQAKRLRLDPPAQDSETIDEYQERVLQILPDDRTKFHVTLPWDGVYDQIRKQSEERKVSHLSSQGSLWSSNTLKSLQTQVDELRTTCNQIQTSHNEASISSFSMLLKTAYHPKRWSDNCNFIMKLHVPGKFSLCELDISMPFTLILSSNCLTHSLSVKT